MVRFFYVSNVIYTQKYNHFCSTVTKKSINMLKIVNLSEYLTSMASNTMATEWLAEIYFSQLLLYVTNVRQGWPPTFLTPQI